MIKQIKVGENFEILDKNGNYLELGQLYLKENFSIISQKIEDYSLLIKLLGHANKFTPEELENAQVSNEVIE